MLAKEMKRPPRTVSELFPSPWLSPDDLPAAPVVMVVSAAELIEVYSIFEKGNVWKLAISFETIKGQRAAKRLICNKTQAEAMAELSGTEEFARWPGLAVTLGRGIAHNRKPTTIVTPAPKATPAAEPMPQAEAIPPAGEQAPLVTDDEIPFGAPDHNYAE